VARSRRCGGKVRHRSGAPSIGLMLIMDGLNAGGAVRGRAGAAPAGVAFAEEVIRHALGPRGTDMRPAS
jgi:hypothetical protein